MMALAVIGELVGMGPIFNLDHINLYPIQYNEF